MPQTSNYLKILLIIFTILIEIEPNIIKPAYIIKLFSQLNYLTLI